ncbi:MAG TPA: DUF47 family protein [bacterium]|nr:DUF47 family protein [bacterium]
MPVLFRKTKEMESKIDDYLDLVIRGGLLFKEGLKYYLTGEMDTFDERLASIDSLESEADELRREIENRLYTQTLIPESRGDVLGIIENTDAVLNVAAETLMMFSVERPQFPTDLHQMIRDLGDASVTCIEELIATIRSYFRDVERVRDGTNRVLFFEKEVDTIADRIKRKIFHDDAIGHLSLKMHLRDCIEDIENISDTAEEVSDRLSIAAIKRSV